MKRLFSICVLLHSEHEKTAELRRFLTGDERIELPLRVLETPVIPLDQSPLSDNIHYKDFITYPQNRIYDLPHFLVKPSPD